MAPGTWRSSRERLLSPLAHKGQSASRAVWSWSLKHVWAVPLPAPNKNKRIMAMAPRSVDDGTGTKLPVGKILEELSIMFTYVSEFLRKVMRRALHASRSTCSTRIAPMHTADAGVALAQANARPHLCRWRACCCWPKGGGLKCRAHMSHIQSAAPLLCRRPCLAASCPLLAAGP